MSHHENHDLKAQADPELFRWVMTWPQAERQKTKWTS